MRRSVMLFILGIQLGVLSWWILSLRFQIGLDSLQYQREATGIVQDGLAPWIVSPLSYVGIYPGSDSSGVPFLAASISILSGMTMPATVLVYDAALIVSFGLGLFLVTRQATGRTDVAIIAILMGSLAFGFFTGLSWSLEERLFDVALTPLFFLLIFPGEQRGNSLKSRPRFVVLGLVSLVMLVSHLDFLLLIPFVILVPLVYRVAKNQLATRRSRRASVFFFAAIVASPLLLLAALDWVGVLSDLGLQYQLESSALFTGSSPLTFLLNAFVFISTRVGPVTMVLAAAGLLYLASRRYLMSNRIAMGGLLLAGFVGLPIVLYSKDLLMPLFVILGCLGLGALIPRENRARAPALALAVAVIASGCIGFNLWNGARTQRADETVYWPGPGVTPEAQSANNWIGGHQAADGCVVGNNPLAVQEVVVNPGEPLCVGFPIDVMLNAGVSTALPSNRIRVVFIGFSDVNPGNWFASPSLEKITNDLSSVASLNFAEGRDMLLRYNVTFVVVDLEKPNEVPLFLYGGSQQSPFFTQLWDNSYPLYRTTTYAVFDLS